MLRTMRETWRANREAYSIAKAGGNVVVLEADQMAGLQSETEGWRRLSGSDRDLSAWDQTRMQEVAFYLSRKNHLARRILMIIEDFVIGDGLIVTAKNELVQEALVDFWEDPINAMDELNGPRAREWQLWGEICIPVTESAGGFTRIGWLDPSHIEAIIPDRAGRAQELKLTASGHDLLRMDKLKVVAWDDQKRRLEGDCFFSKINAPLGGVRGVSELYTASDWIDALEEHIFTQLDRSRLLNSFIWQVELQGQNQAALDAWAKKYGTPPEPNSVRVVNEKAKWSAINPQFGAYEASRQQKDLTDYTLGGVGIPSHWFGSGDDANLATAAVMAEPTRKLLKRKQKEFITLTKKILTYAIERRRLGGTLNVSDEDARAFEVTIPDFSGPDIAKVGSSISALVSAILQAEDAEYFTKRTSRRLAATVFSELGTDIDVDDEEAEIEKEAAERKKNEDEQREKDEADEDARNQGLRIAAKAAEDAAAAEREAS